jgi:GAF domain-containing protein
MAEVDEGLVESLGALARLLQPAAAAFESMARMARLVVPGCDHASVSVLAVTGEVTTAGASDALTVQLDDLQYEADEGPCLSAIRSGSPVQVDEFISDRRFPTFAAAAAAVGASSCLSLPLSLGEETIGGLNLYGDAPHAYNEISVKAGEEIAGQASLVVASVRAYERSLKLVDQLHLAMGSRAEIEQAKGILMARSHCDADRAFDVLRRASQRQNVKLRDIAHTIVINTAAGLTGMSPDDGA